MRYSPAFLTFFALAFFSLDVSAFFNFANSTRLTVNGSHIITAYPKKFVLPTGYGTGTGVVSANSTAPASSTVPSTASSTVSSFISASTTAIAQQPLPGVPQPAQQSQSALITSSSSPLPTTTTTHSSTNTTPNTVAAATERSPSNAVQQGNPRGPAKSLPSTGNGQPAPGQAPASSGGDNLSPGPAPTNGALASAPEPTNNQGEPLRSVMIVGNAPVIYNTLASNLVIGGSNTLTPGGTITVNNVPVYLPTAGSAVVISSSTIPLEPSPVGGFPTISGTPIAIQGQTLTPGGVVTVDNALISRPTSGSAFIIGGTRTLNPGTTVVVDNVPVVFPTSGSFIAIGSSVITLRPSFGPTAPSITPAPVVVQGHTLTPGGIITISDTPISLPPSGSVLIVGGSNTFPFGPTHTLSIGSQALDIAQITSTGDIVIGDQTLTPGEVITVANPPLFPPTSGPSLVVGGSNTIALGGAQTIAIDTQMFVISRLSTSSALVIDGQVVALGSQTVITGVTVSIPTQGNDVIIDGSSTARLGGAFVPTIGNAPSATVAEGTLTKGSLPAGESNRTTVLSGGFTAGSAPSDLVIWKNSLIRIGAGLGCVWAGAWI